MKEKGGQFDRFQNLLKEHDGDGGAQEKMKLSFAEGYLARQDGTKAKSTYFGKIGYIVLIIVLLYWFLPLLKGKYFVWAVIMGIYFIVSGFCGC